MSEDRLLELLQLAQHSWHAEYLTQKALEGAVQQRKAAHAQLEQAYKELHPHSRRGVVWNLCEQRYMFPEDCTCKFQGSCLDYCNPYK